MNTNQMKASILLVDDEPNIVKTVRICLESAGHEITAFLNPLQALEAMREQTFDIGFYDLKMQPIDGLELLRRTRQISPDMTVVIMTAHGSIDSAVEAIKQGAYDYLQKPFEFSELQHLAEKIIEHRQLVHEVEDLRNELRRLGETGVLVTRSEKMKGVVDLAMQMAPSGIPVLIEGESGTGKELLAHMIHRNSPRAGKPFITVNCSALAETLLESELFGHVKGAFTGAVRDREGRFAAADGGTVFLDEVGEIPVQTQVKFLRFLQSKEFERVGETVTRKVDVRVVTATNRNLEEAVRNGSFREDLFYRINAVRLKLPPLRERVEDIPLLTEHFLQQRQVTKSVTADAQKALSAYPWRGNVRELENVIERAVILARGDAIGLQHLPDEFQSLVEQPGILSLEEVEQRHIVRVLKVTKDLDEAAAVLGIDPATLWRKRKKYNL